jgi:hypothetical protein
MPPSPTAGATVTFPQDVLQLKATSWSQCGNSPDFAGAIAIKSGASVWISAATPMLTACPASPMIMFEVTYLEDNQQKTLPPTPYGDEALGALDFCTGR